jgi:hypothetical protein
MTKQAESVENDNNSSEVANRMKWEEIYNLNTLVAQKLCMKDGIFDLIHGINSVPELQNLGLKVHINPRTVRVEIKEKMDITIKKLSTIRDSIKYLSGIILSNNTSVEDLAIAKMELKSAKEDYVEIISDLKNGYNYVLNEFHILKSPESLEVKIPRVGSIENVTDMIRGTLISEKPFTENQLNLTLDKVIGIFYKTPVCVGRENCYWELIATDGEYTKITDVNYSDVTLKFKTVVKGVTIYFELQLNTQKFLDAKKIETGYYDERKELTNRINTIMQACFKCSRKTGISGLNRLIKNLYKLNLINENVILSNTENPESFFKDKAHSVINNFIRNYIQHKNISSDDKKFNGKTLRLKEIIKKLYTLIEKYGIAYLKSVECYKNLGGVVENKPTAKRINNSIRDIREKYEQERVANGNEISVIPLNNIVSMPKRIGKGGRFLLLRRENEQTTNPS